LEEGLTLKERTFIRLTSKEAGDIIPGYEIIIIMNKILKEPK